METSGQKSPEQAKSRLYAWKNPKFWLAVVALAGVIGMVFAVLMYDSALDMFNGVFEAAETPETLIEPAADPATN